MYFFHEISLDTLGSFQNVKSLSLSRDMSLRNDKTL